MVTAVAARPASPASFSAVAEVRAQASEKRREARLADAREAIETLKAARVSSRDVQKEMARRKLEEIKERIRMLKMTASMDPAGAARQIAALARELAGALKAYSAATAKGPGIAGSADLGSLAVNAGDEVNPAASSPLPDQALSQGSASIGDRLPDANGSDVNPDVSSPPAGEAGSQMMATTGVKVQASRQETGSGHDPAKAAAAGARAAELYRQIQSSPERVEREKALEARRAQAAEAEDFMRQVRDLAKTLKEILQKVAEAAKANGESGRNDVEDAEKSLGQLAQQIGFAAATQPAAPVAVAA